MKGFKSLDPANKSRDVVVGVLEPANQAQDVEVGVQTENSSYKEKGLILVATLMLLALLALLVLSQMQALVLEYKLLNWFRDKQQAFWNIETAASKLVLHTGYLRRNECVLNEQDPNQVIHFLNNQKGCVLGDDKQKFYYFIEDLGVFPCLQLKSNNRLHSTQHFRISLKSNERHKAILQIRFAILTKFVHCESEKPSRGKTGLLSWRYLSES